MFEFMYNIFHSFSSHNMMRKHCESHSLTLSIHKDMKNILQKFSQHRELTNVSSLAVAILTHGGANDCLFGTDGQLCSGQPVPGTYITKMDMIHFFKGSVCQAMEGKPKLFILQACRGSNSEQ